METASSRRSPLAALFAKTVSPRIAKVEANMRRAQLNTDHSNYIG